MAQPVSVAELAKLPLGASVNVGPLFAGVVGCASKDTLLTLTALKNGKREFTLTLFGVKVGVCELVEVGGDLEIAWVGG